MNTIKTGFLILTAFLFTTTVKAQNLEDGKKLFFYEKYKSAKDFFSQMTNNVDATYWLGQTLLATEDITGAKTLYQQTLSANPNSPLLIAGMGHIELLEGKTQDARQRFETAISLSQGKNAAVLNAIGFANVDVKNGDADYAIDKLKQATALKGMKDPDVYINLGDAYKKNVDGGLAQTAYESALALNKNYARASYKIGKIYQTQGASQEDIFMKYYNEAIAKDPSFAPVYYNLYDYYYKINVLKSGEYLEKYLTAKGDDEPNACYYRVSMKYAQGQFADAISGADACIAASASPYPNLYGLKAYAYSRLQDSAKAKASFDEYFIHQKADKIGAGDYAAYAAVLLKFPGNDSLAGTYTDKAVSLDSTEAGKVALLKGAAEYYESRKKFDVAAIWYNKILSVKKNLTKTDIYNAGYNSFRSGNYQSAISAFNTYSQKFPEDAFGYYMNGKANWAIDSTMALGAANPFFEKAIAVGMADSVKYKNQIIGSCRYFVAYYANIKKDKASAIAYCDKILSIEPTDAEALANKTAIANMNMSAPATKPATKPAAPKTTGAKTPPKKK
ncbi:hypothetical protein LK994_00850 [Ferruginibacter lapsinanis]|uniref:tetratricopeptide repeat protein n=1 Tax=Ferruginibacter lapsinanis TaxID=563172 RepID=UPI001E3ABA82|nr:hypothetical protein [Ferruginibacter lapsinanis]UEG50021.1 hypothetical protein LK994_00850 [Ferruginibacter lapsinanis]